MTPEERAIEAATSALRTHGRQEFERGFLLGISAAWTILRWATAAKPQVPRRDIAVWAHGKIAEAYRRAEMEVPEDGREP